MRLQLIREWSDVMKTSSTWKFRSIVGKMMMGLVIAVMIGGSIDVVPALGKNDKKAGRYDNRRYQQRGHVYDRGHHVQGRPYGYYGQRARVYYPPPRVYYPPPPVIYEPPPPPGISIFLPPIFIPIR